MRLHEFERDAVLFVPEVSSGGCHDTTAGSEEYRGHDDDDHEFCFRETQLTLRSGFHLALLLSLTLERVE